MKNKKRVLIVGDLMMDKAWTLRDSSSNANATVQTHGGRVPYCRVLPTARDYRPGGAGLAALAMLNLGNCEVHLLSARASDLDIDSFRKSGLVYSESATSESVSWHRLEWSPPAVALTIIKWRLYEVQEGRSSRSLLSRVDQDPPPGASVSPELPSTLSESYDAILFWDFAKGTVTGQLMKNLFKKYEQTGVWAIDSKNVASIRLLSDSVGSSKDKKSFVFMNRKEAIKYLGCICPPGSVSEKFEGDLAQMMLDDDPTEQFLDVFMASVSAISKAKEDSQITWVFKKDQQGAISFNPIGRETGELKYKVVWGKSKVLAEEYSVGAGDLFGTGFISSYLMQGNGDEMGVHRSATEYALRWMMHSEKFSKSFSEQESELPSPTDSDMKMSLSESVSKIGLSEKFI